MDSTRILVTGANGFIGRALLHRLVALPDLSVRAATRDPASGLSANVDSISVGDISDTTNWRPAVSDIDVVIHTAGRARVMKETHSDPLQEFRRVNVQGTLSLARQAAEAGVRRRLFLSSVKVNGERTLEGSPFRTGDLPNPSDPYGQSKLEAELGLSALARETGLPMVILRLPLVYGPGVKGNVNRRLQFVKSGIPLPFGMVHNQRSMVNVENLTDLVLRCVLSKGVEGRTLLVSDAQDLSTSELISLIASAMDRTPHLFPVPLPLLRVVGTLLGMRAEIDRLCNSLQVDIMETGRLLNWQPPVPVEEGIQKTVRAFLQDAK